MPKTETVHTRVTKDIKDSADQIFNSLGLTTSQAITLFLTAAVNNRGLPFELVQKTQDDLDYEFAKSIAMVDGVEPSKKAERIMKLYSNGIIDYETAKFAIKRMYVQ